MIRLGQVSYVEEFLNSNNIENNTRKFNYMLFISKIVILPIENFFKMF